MSEGALPLAKRLNERGLDFEEWCAKFLEAHGYAVRFRRDHEIWDPDLVVAPNIPIEVKGSSLRKLAHGKLGYGFVLHKANRSRPIHEPVVAFVCHDQHKHLAHYLFVPADLVRERHYIEFKNPDPRISLHRQRSLYGLAPFYQSFTALEQLGAQRTKEND